MLFNAIGITKFVLGTATGASVNMIVGNIIKATTPKDITAINKAVIGFGTFVVSAMVADATIEYLNAQIDELVETVIQKKKESETKTEVSVNEAQTPQSNIAG